MLADRESRWPSWLRYGAGVAGDIFLEVRAANRPAIGLYKRMGFAVVGRRRDYYRDPAADALIMKSAARAGTVE